MGKKSKKKKVPERAPNGSSSERNGSSEQPHGTAIITRERNDEVTFDKKQDALLWKMAEGKNPYQLAKDKFPDDKRKQATYRRRIYRMYESQEMQDELGARAKLIGALGIGAAVKALNRKAAAGRVDAIKLLFEATGFYNPRVQHEHGGEIQITIKNAPRPGRVEDEYTSANTAGMPEVIDAEVVSE